MRAREASLAFQLERDGFELLSCPLQADQLEDLERILPASAARAGVRIYGNSELERWLLSSEVGRVTRSILGPNARAVRAILFDKNPTTNWALAWHQDRTIAVRRRSAAPGFEHWTEKSGAIHVEPPFSIIEGMLTARIHLDSADAANAPLLVSPGSHRLGRIAEREIDAIVSRCGSIPCLASRGDVWLYRTAILHSSEKSRSSQRRRVLQVDFSAEDLPPGLEWLGLA